MIPHRHGLLVATITAWSYAPEMTAQTPKWHHLHGGLINDVTFYDENQGCTAEDGGRIRYTEDGGISWTYAVVPQDVTVDLFSVVYVDEDNLYACGDKGIIIKSTNGGATWEDANPSARIVCGSSPPVPAKLQDIYMISAGNSGVGFVVGYDGAIAKTTSGWSSSPTRPGVPTEFDCGGADMYDIHIFKESGSTLNK